MSKQIVIISQDPESIRVLEEALHDQPVEVYLARSPAAGVERLSHASCDLVIASTSALDGSIKGSLERLRAVAANAPIFLLAAPEEQLPHDTDAWFEVLRTPIRREVVRWLVECTLLGRPSRLFKLYLSGRGSHAQACAQRVRGMLDHAMKRAYELEVIDILRSPNRARLDQVRATPTLVRMGPTPRRQIVGIDDAKVARAWDPAEVRW